MLRGIESPPIGGYHRFRMRRSSQSDHPITGHFNPFVGMLTSIPDYGAGFPYSATYCTNAATWRACWDAHEPYTEVIP